MKIGTGLLSVVVLFGAEAHAQEKSLGVRAGMLGLGFEYSHVLGNRFALRGGIYGSGYSFDETESGIDYQFDLEWDSISVALDFHPSTGPFRLSGGLLKNDNRLSAESRVSSDVTVGGTTYTPAEVGTLRGDVSFDGTAPFLSVGWDWSRNKRFGVVFDFGVVRQGSPRVSLSADGGLVANQAFEDDLKSEEAELSASLKELDLIPFANLGVVFRF